MDIGSRMRQPLPSNAGGERKGVHEGAMVLAVAPLQFQVRLSGRRPDGPLVAGQGLGVTGGDGDVADQVDAGRAAGEVFSALVEAVGGGGGAGGGGAVAPWGAGG